MADGKIRVLVVDDSSMIRALYTKVLAREPDIEVVGAAPDPYVARDILLNVQPDVMTLDIEMPRMDGLTFLGKVMSYCPTRTLIVSSLSARDSEMAYRALELGAVDVLEKPTAANEKTMREFCSTLVNMIREASQARLQPSRELSVKPHVARPASKSLARTTHQILAIASSTGGTSALRTVLSELPSDLPGTVVVQHMPEKFTPIFAKALAEVCPFEVKEAEDGDRIVPGRLLLAPGNYHLEVARSGGYYVARLHQNPQMHGVRPAADYLFRSVAEHVGANAIGLILTGMGRDGAEGLLAMREAGSYNIAQDEATSVVFGMPKEAIRLGAIHKVLPLDQIATELVNTYEKRLQAS